MVMGNQSIQCSLCGCRRLYSADIFAAIGHKHHLLVLLHPLPLQQLPQAPARLLIVGWHKSEALGRRHFALFFPPERHHAFACDDFKPSLPWRLSDTEPWTGLGFLSGGSESAKELRIPECILYSILASAVHTVDRLLYVATTG
jgi:hypothetical protein